MTSYKIFKLEIQKKISEIFSQNWLENVEAKIGDIETVNQKIDLIRNQVKSPILVKNSDLASNAYTLSYQFNMELPGNNKIWVPQEMYILQSINHVFMSKGAGDIRFAAQKYLDKEARIYAVDFFPKKLITVYNRIKKNGNQKGYDIILHRIILHKTYLNGDFIREVNISTKNVDEIGNFSKILSNTEKIYVITFKIKWNLIHEDGSKIKDLTARIDSSGNLLIYGNHSSDIIDKFLVLLTNSITS